MTMIILCSAYLLSYTSTYAESDVNCCYKEKPIYDSVILRGV